MRVLGESPLRVGWVTWRFVPAEARIVVAVKATLVPVDGARCAFAVEPKFVTGDAHWDGDVDLSVRWDSDLALVKPVGEAWITGVVCSVEPVVERLCSVRVGPLEARFAVVGDRVRRRDGSVTPAAPFTAMPLCWERCFGGAGFSLNPFGRGLQVGSDGSVPLPNIEDPDRLIRAAGDRPRPRTRRPSPMRTSATRASRVTYARPSGSAMSTRSSQWPTTTRCSSRTT